MKLWIDDERPPPDRDWQVARTIGEALFFLYTEQIKEISLDHDLGMPTFRDADLIANLIEELAVHNRIPRMKWSIQTDNAAGIPKLLDTMESCDRWWNKHEGMKTEN